MKRAFDLVLSILAFLLTSLPMIVVAILVKLTSRGPILYWSDRIGKENAIFKMPKFRTMWIDTPPIATHLVTHPRTYLTPVGEFLRKSSLDELPQLFSVIRGDMSLVGPRPALFNQDDLITMRTEKGIHTLKPGITGWAQINGRDELPLPVKVEYDEYYSNHRSLGFDVRILVLTVIRVIRHEGVTH